MLQILGSFLTAETLDIAGLLAYTGWRRRAERQQLLLYPKTVPRRLWLVDTQMQKRIGPISKVHKAGAARLVNLARWLTNTRAFEHLVAGMINPKSSWHTREPAINATVRIFL